MIGAATPFAARVLKLVSQIPPGRVATYGDLARLAGHPGAARAVGTLMRTSTRRDLPYHRVIATNGRLGGYGGRPDFKAARLREEGVVVVGNRVRGFAAIRWLGASPRPPQPREATRRR